MKRANTAVVTKSLNAVLAVVLVSVLGISPARAHCDTTSGPVIAEAKAALDMGDVTPVLKWVKPEDEAEIRAAFAQVLRVRAKEPRSQGIGGSVFSGDADPHTPDRGKPPC